MLHDFLGGISSGGSITADDGRCTSDGIFLNQSMKNALFKLPVYFRTAMKPTMIPPMAIHFSLGDFKGIGDTNFC